MKESYYTLISPVKMAQVDVSPDPTNPGVWVICRIITPVGYRHKGYARNLMQQLLADADAEGIILTLGINAYGDMTYEQLDAWYKRLGFQWTQHPSMGTPCMIRIPVMARNFEHVCHVDALTGDCVVRDCAVNANPELYMFDIRTAPDGTLTIFTADE